MLLKATLVQCNWASVVNVVLTALYGPVCPLLLMPFVSPLYIYHIAQPISVKSNPNHESY